jgi:hypothetical protein
MVHKKPIIPPAGFMAPLWARPIGPGQLQFSEVCHKVPNLVQVPNLVHLGDTPISFGEYAATVAWANLT